MGASAAKGNLEMVRWLHENRGEGCSPIHLDNVAKNGHLEVLKFFYEHRSERCTGEAMRQAGTTSKWSSGSMRTAWSGFRCWQWTTPRALAIWKW